MIFDKHLEPGNKFKLDCEHYVSTIENVDEATIRKYVWEQEEESYKEARPTRWPLQKVVSDRILIPAFRR